MKRILYISLLLIICTVVNVHAQDSSLRYSVLNKSATVSGLPATISTTLPTSASDTAKMLDLAKQSGKSKVAFKVLKYLPIVGTAIYIAWDIYDLMNTVEQNLPSAGRKTGTIWQGNIEQCNVSLYTGNNNTFDSSNAAKIAYIKVRSSDCKVEFQDEESCSEPSHLHTQQQFTIPQIVVQSSYNTETFNKYCPETFYIGGIKYDTTLKKSFTLQDFLQTSWSVQNVTNYITNNYQTVNNYMNNPDKQSVTVSDTLPSNAVEVTAQTVPNAVTTINNNTNINYIPVVDQQTGKAVDVITGQQYQQKMTTEQSQNTTEVTAPSLPTEPIFDTDITAPEKKDIKSKLQSFVTNHPLLNVLKDVQLQAVAGECYLPFTLLGKDMKINFCQHESIFNTIGNVILAFATLYGAFIILKV